MLSVSSTCSLFPHLYALHGEAARGSIAPSRKPIVHAVPEFFGSSRTLVAPRFAPNTIWEKSIGSADRNVQDQEEGLIEGRTRLSGLHPWIVEGGVVDQRFAEAAAVPHGLVEFDEEDLLVHGQRGTC